MNDDAVRQVVLALGELGIPFLIAGSLSSNVYGVTRSTEDADIVVQLEPGQLGALADRLGPSYFLDPQPSFESVTFTKRYVIDVRGSEFKIELFELSEDAHDQERFARRRAGSLCGINVWVAAPEDVVITKMRWYHIARRTKDWDDIYALVTIQRDVLDWPYIETWCDRHSSREHLEKLRALVATSGI